MSPTDAAMQAATKTIVAAPQGTTTFLVSSTAYTHSHNTAASTVRATGCARAVSDQASASANRKHMTPLSVTIGTIDCPVLRAFSPAETSAMPFSIGNVSIMPATR